MKLHVPLNKDTSLIRTLYVVPRVSVLLIERFHCIMYDVAAIGRKTRMNGKAPQIEARKIIKVYTCYAPTDHT